MNKNLLYAILFLFSALVIGFASGYSCAGKQSPQITIDTIFVHDTFVKPICTDSSITRYIVRTLALHDTTVDYRIINDTMWYRDSVDVEIPITTKAYQGSNYRAVISGYEATLDSIMVTSTIINQSTITKKKRWGIGIQTGFGGNQKGMSPYIGIGISYNLINF